MAKTEVYPVDPVAVQAMSNTEGTAIVPKQGGLVQVVEHVSKLFKIEMALLTISGGWVAQSAFMWLDDEGQYKGSIDEAPRAVDELQETPQLALGASLGRIADRIAAAKEYPNREAVGNALTSEVGEVIKGYQMEIVTPAPAPTPDESEDKGGVQTGGDDILSVAQSELLGGNSEDSEKKEEKTETTSRRNRKK